MDSFIGTRNATGKRAVSVRVFFVLSIFFAFSSSLLAQSTSATLPNVNFYAAGYVNAIAFQTDGTILIGGLFTAVNGVPRSNLARLNPDGSLDMNWNPNCDGTVYVVAAGDDAVFVGGAFGQVGGQPRNGLAKLALTGAGDADVNWDPAADVSNIAVHAMTLSGSYLYVGGVFDTLGGQRIPSLGRLDTTTGLADPNWNPVPDGPVESIVVDGVDVYIGGTFETIGRGSAKNLAKLDVWVGLKSPWDPAPSGTVMALAVDQDYVYLGGTFDSVRGLDRQNIARVSKGNGGEVDASWNPGANGRIVHLVSETGGVFAVGDFTRIGAQPRVGIARLLLSEPGFADPVWRMQGDEGSSGQISILAINGSELYVGGGFHSLGARIALALVKVNASSGAVVDSFPALVERPGIVKALAKQDDGKIVLGGDFQLAGDAVRLNLARLSSDRTLDTSWAPQVDGPVLALALESTNIYIGGAFANVGAVPRNHLAKLTDAGSLDPAWDPNVTGGDAVFTVAFQAGSLYVGGEFSQIGGAVRRNLAKIDSSGTGQVDPNWIPDDHIELGGEIDQLTVVDQSVYVAGTFGTIGGQPRNTLARLDASGSGEADPAWNPQVEGQVRGFTIVGSDLYALEDQTIVKLSTLGSGELDPTWRATADEYLRSIVNVGDSLYVGGNFQSIGGQAQRFLARFKLAVGGSADPTWNRPIEDFYAPVVALLPSGNGLYIGGNFTDIGGDEHVGLALLPVLHPPDVSILDDQVLLSPNSADGSDVTGFWVTGLDGVTLSLADGITPLKLGDFVTVQQAADGLRFTGTGILMVAADLNSDSVGATASAVATVYLANGLAAVRLTAASPPLNGNVALTLQGAANGVFSILASQTLAQSIENWAEVGTITNQLGVTTFTNQLPASATQLFYRAKQL